MYILGCCIFSEDLWESNTVGFPNAGVTAIILRLLQVTQKLFSMVLFYIAMQESKVDGGKGVSCFLYDTLLLKVSTLPEKISTPMY